MPQLRLDALREKIRNCLEQNLHETAAFLADKLIALSNRCFEDIYLLAKALFLGREYRRVIYLLDANGLLSVTQDGFLGEGVSLKYILLAAQCWIENGQYGEALDYLEQLLGTITDNRELEVVVEKCASRFAPSMKRRNIPA